MLRDNRGPFSRSTHGFASFRFTPDVATVQLIGADGTIVHEFSRSREGNVTVTLNSPSDPATKHKLKAINGIDDK
jgi:hypothetical protein